jgi:hypothetical protein
VVRELDPLAKAIAFAALHHALFALHLGGVFAPNHKGMEMPQSTSRWEHLEKPLGIGLRAKRCDSNA